MKHTIITLALILALAMSCVAMAEETPGNLPAEGTDIVEEMPNDTAPEEPEVAPDSRPDDAPTSNEPADAAPTDDLKAAMDAYRAAKQDKAMDDLEEELDGFVEDGSLTQEQADLILNSVKERIAAKNGECPNCGYKFDKKDKRFPGQRQFPGQKQFPGQNQMPSQDRFPGQDQFPASRTSAPACRAIKTRSSFPGSSRCPEISNPMLKATQRPGIIAGIRCPVRSRFPVSSRCPARSSSPVSSRCLATRSSSPASRTAIR